MTGAFALLGPALQVEVRVCCFSGICNNPKGFIRQPKALIRQFAGLIKPQKVYLTA